VQNRFESIKIGALYVSDLTDGSIGGFNSGFFDAWLGKLDADSDSLLDFFGTSRPVNNPPTQVYPSITQVNSNLTRML
jgi:hypothetical protein